MLAICLIVCCIEASVWPVFASPQRLPHDTSEHAHHTPRWWHTHILLPTHPEHYHSTKHSYGWHTIANSEADVLTQCGNERIADECSDIDASVEQHEKPGFHMVVCLRYS